MSAAATVPSSGTTPTVLVVGFDADQILRKRYEGQALFNTSGPEAIMRPDHIPAGVAAVFMRSGVLRVHQERISNLCEAGGRRCLFEILGSLPLLRDRLEEYFTPFPPARPDEDLARIRALNCRSGSQSAWIRDRMNYPCNYKVEADRLLPELRAQFPHASGASVYQTLLTIVHRAGLRGSRTERAAASFLAQPHSSNLTVTNTRKLLEQLEHQLSVFSTEFAAVLKTLRGIESAAALTIQEQSAQVEELQMRVREFEADARELRRIRGEILKGSSPTRK